MSTIDTQIDSFVANLEAKGYQISDFALFSPGSIPLQANDFSPIGQSCADEGTNQEVWFFQFEVCLSAAGKNIATSVMKSVIQVIRDFRDSWRDIPGASGGNISARPSGQSGNILTITIDFNNIYIQE